MTIISDTLADLAGRGDGNAIVFWAPLLRDSAAGDRIVTPQYVTVPVDNEGSFVTPELEPGPARVRIDGIAYDIAIPADWDAPVRLMPLIAAGLPVPPDEEAHAIRNLGGVAAGVVCTLDWYEALPVVDPETVYLIPE